MTVTEVELKIIETHLDIDQMRIIGLPEEVIREKEKQLDIYNQMLEAINRGNVIPDRNVPNALMKRICGVFAVNPEDMFRKCRKRKLVTARQAYLYLLKTTDVHNQKVIPFEKTKFFIRDPHMNKRDSPVALAAHVGLDHSSILHNVRVMADLVSVDKYHRALIEGIQDELLKGLIPMPDVTVQIPRP